MTAYIVVLGARKLHRDQEQAVIRRATTDQKNPRQPVLILPRPEKPHEWHRLPQPTNLSVAVAMMASFDTLAYERYNDGNPCLDHLLSLSKFNVLRAIIGNSKVLGLTTQDMQDDMLSPFNSPTRIAPIGWDLPASLYPTPVQRAIPHHPWLDCFPFPLLRENLIRASGALNDCELCGDVMDPANEEIGMLVWGDPWMPQNWEVSETFLRKWFWVVNECPEILWSTNHWRMKRGMRRVDFTMLSRISSSHQMTRVQRKGA